MAGKRNQISTVKKLPPDVVAEIDKLRIQHGWEIDELVEFVRSKGGEVSRSAMGRYTKSLHLSVDAAAEKLQRSEGIAKGVIERLGDKPDNELARLNIQLVHGQVLDMLLREEEMVEDEKGNLVEPAGDSLKLVRLSTTVQKLLSAEKMNIERIKELKRMGADEEKQRAMAALEEAADKGHLRRDALAEAKRIMGYD